MALHHSDDDVKDDPARVLEAAQRIARGELVAFPTETVYGLGARADDDAAVTRIYRTKGRPDDHPLIVHIADGSAVEAFANDVPEPARRLMTACWPGPVTVILKRRDGVARAAAAGQATIGLRCPAHPLAQALLLEARALGVPGIAGPSANRFGRISPTSAEHVRAEFDHTVSVLDGGPCEVGIESAIVDFTRVRPALLRPGARTLDELCRAADTAIDADPGVDAPRASGTLAAHYAPKATLRLMDAAMLESALEVIGAQGVPRLAVYSRTVRAPRRGVAWRHMPTDARAAAHELFAVLRELDAAGAALIWVETPPEDPSWEGVRDRLRRAAAAG